MIFLNTQDIQTKISDNILYQITENLSAVLDNAEAQAIALVKDYLNDIYDIDTELQKTNDNRHQNLVRWITDITIYFIYNRIPDAQIPERVFKNYDDVRQELKDIATGKRQSTLTKISFTSSNGTTQNVTYIGYNNKQPRDYNPF